MQVVPGETAQRNAIQPAVPARLVQALRIVRAGQRIRAHAREPPHIVARGQGLDSQLFLEPRAVQKVLGPVLLPGQVGIVEIQPAIQDDFAAGPDQRDAPNAAAPVQALKHGQRVLARLLDSARDLEPPAHARVVDVQRPLEIADAVAVPRGGDARRGPDAGHQVRRLEEDLRVDTLGDRRERLRSLGNRLLVPVGHRGTEVRPVLEVVRLRLAGLRIRDRGKAATFQLDFQRLAERDGGLDVPAVRREPAVFSVGFLDGHARIGVGEQTQIPSVVEEVFASGADDRRLGFAVDVEPVVRFAEPAAIAALDRKHSAHVMALPAAVENHVRRERFGGRLLAIAGVKVQHVVGGTRQFRPVELPVHGQRVAAFVRQLDACLSAERHPPVAVQGPAVRSHLDRQRVHVGTHPIARGKEVAERRFDRRRFGGVPVDPQDQRAGITPLASRDGKPHVADLARARQRRQRGGFAGAEMPGVLIRLGIEQPAGRATRFALDRAGDFRQWVGGGGRRHCAQEHGGQAADDGWHAKILPAGTAWCAAGLGLRAEVL